MQTKATRGSASRGALGALALANLRFWPTVAPRIGRELAHWEALAGEIQDIPLRAIALQKLTDERFNAEVAATLATAAPRQTRVAAVTAIVALEVLFDYLDGRTEQPAEDPLGEGLRQFAPFIDAVRPRVKGREVSESGAVQSARGPEEADARYTHTLADRAREHLLVLPAAEQIATVALAGAERCAQAQTRLHASATLGDGMLEAWAREQALGSGLQWREHLAGSAASVLALHALIALATEARVTRTDAERTDAAYLAIAGVITMLDSLVDDASDRAHGAPGLIRLFDSRQALADSLRELTREALARIGEAPRRAHHEMVLAGAVAYYTSHPAAREPHARAVVAVVRRELAPMIWPALGVMHVWRAMKALHARASLGGFL